MPKRGHGLSCTVLADEEQFLWSMLLLVGRWVRALLEVMEQQGAVLRNLYSQQKGSKAAKRWVL